MPKKRNARRSESDGSALDLQKVSQKTARKELIWLKGNGEELDVYRVPIKYLYFNIANGRYADKMIHLRAAHPGVEIDPREEKWKNEIWRMLKGEYKGTETDKDAFTRLRSDLLARRQLRPGVVLSDGGVLDGNRRFAVLRDLHESQTNPGRFEYFDAVILPERVGEEDRWRIEAGLQIGKDEKLDYSPINRLLKIKQGLEIFSSNKNPAEQIANTLIGISKSEVERDIQKIKLIDSYLVFIKKQDAYDLVSGVIERFEEALNAVESAKKARWPPDRMAQLRTKLFAGIRFQTMDNWEMRDIWRAMGVPGKGKSPRFKNDRALNEFLKPDCPLVELQEALVKGDGKGEVAKQQQKSAEAFLDQMQASKAVHEPPRLAQRARTDLEQLLQVLEGGGITAHKGWERTILSLAQTLSDVVDLAAKCAQKAKALQKARVKKGTRR